MLSYLYRDIQHAFERMPPVLAWVAIGALGASLPAVTNVIEGRLDVLIRDTRFVLNRLCVRCKLLASGAAR